MLFRSKLWNIKAHTLFMMTMDLGIGKTSTASFMEKTLKPLRNAKRILRQIMPIGKNLTEGLLPIEVETGLRPCLSVKRALMRLWRDKMAAKRGRKGVEKQWNFYLSNGEKLGVLSYTKPEILRLFPTAKIGGDNVYL